jgi:hypothetical protein
MSRSKWRSFSMLNSNFAAVTLASLVIPLFTGQFDIARWQVVVLGIISTSSLAWISLLSAEKGKL